MKQVSKNITKKTSSSKNKKTGGDKRLPPKQKIIKERKHQEFGTSIAEQNFARDFLDKLGVRYQWQFKAKEIGRYFDFYLLDYRMLIEYDGTYWHGDDRIYEEKDLNPTQKRAKRIDEQKNQWAILHGIPLIRIKEKDVNECPDKIMEYLKKILRIQENVVEKENKMNKRHINKLKIQ